MTKTSDYQFRKTAMVSVAKNLSDPQKLLKKKCNLRNSSCSPTQTHFYVTKWQIRLEKFSRNVLDTLYGQKVLLLKLKQLLQDDLVAHPRTFAVISHFFSLTSSCVFSDGFEINHLISYTSKAWYQFVIIELFCSANHFSISPFFFASKHLTVVLHMLDHFLASSN